MNARLAALAGLLLLPPVLAAAGAEAPLLPARLTLEQTFALAREHSPRITQAVAVRESAEGDLSATRSALLPSVDLGAGYSITDQDRIEGPGGFTGNDQGWSADLTTTWAVYTGGRAQRALGASKAALEAATRRGEATVDDVLLAAGTAYFDGLLARRQIEVQEQAITVLEEQATLAKRRYEAGSGSSFDVLRTEVALANARPPLVRARNNYRRAIDALRLTLGLAAAPGMDLAAVELTSDWPEAPAGVDLASALARAATGRAELAAAESDVRAAELAVASARGERQPTVAVSAGYGIRSRSFDASLAQTLDGWTAGLSVSVPVFDGGAISGRTRSAAATLRAARSGYEQVRLGVEGEVRRAFFTFEEAREISSTAGLVVRQAEEALRLAQSRFEAGVATPLDLLQAQLDLTRAQTEEVLARRDLQVAALGLRRATGEPVAGR